MKFLVCCFLFLLTALTLPKTTAATPKSVYIDPETGYEIWWMSTSGAPYYSTNPFSPNGKYLAYGYCKFINTDGSNERNMAGLCSGVGEGGIMGWWSHDSKTYYQPEGLYAVDVESNLSSRIPNYSSCLPFYFAEVSPDGRSLFGTANDNDISNGTGIAKIINIDGTNCRSFSSPGRQSGGFDVTHHWLGNDAAWYLNNNQWGQYTDVPMVFNVNSGQFLGPLNVGNQTWDGLFDHPTLSDSGYMIGGGVGYIAGNGTKMSYANTKYTTSNATERQLTVIGSVQGNHTNFSPDGKWIVSGATQGTNAGFIVTFPIPPPLSTSGSNPIKVARFKGSGVSESDSAYANFSPDGTKISFKHFDSNVGLNTVVFQKPPAPTSLQAVNMASQVKLTWKPAFSHREIKEYQVFGSTSQTGTYSQIAIVPALYTYLEAPSKINTSATTINVDSTSGFPDQGTLEIYGLSSERPTEIVSYSGKTATSLTGLTRGIMGSTAAEHYNDSFVWLYTGTHGYQGTTSNSWFKIKSVEWSGLTSEFSAPVSVGGTVIPSPTPSGAPSGATKPGDANGDGLVNRTDLIIWIGNYAKLLSGTNNADFNNNGKVNGLDYGIWYGNFGK